MITVRYERSHSRHTLTVCGHAGYAVRGSDIVCSAASILALTAADLLEMAAEDSPDTAAETQIELSPGQALLSAPLSTAADPVFAFLLRGLALLAERYPEAVSI